jgi:MraZ protein
MGDLSLPSGVTAVYCCIRCPFGKKLPIWEEIEVQLNQLPGLHSNVHLLQRNLTGRTEDLELDTQGRVRLPPQLREFAQLEKHIALVSATQKFERWNEETLAAQHETWAEVTDSHEISAALASLSL